MAIRLVGTIIIVWIAKTKVFRRKAERSRCGDQESERVVIEWVGGSGVGWTCGIYTKVDSIGGRRGGESGTREQE